MRSHVAAVVSLAVPVVIIVVALRVCRMSVAACELT